jgi:hypothetical protein
MAAKKEKTATRTFCRPRPSRRGAFPISLSLKWDTFVAGDQLDLSVRQAFGRQKSQHLMSEEVWCV